MGSSNIEFKKHAILMVKAAAVLLILCGNSETCHAREGKHWWHSGGGSADRQSVGLMSRSHGKSHGGGSHHHKPPSRGHHHHHHHQAPPLPPKGHPAPPPPPPASTPAPEPVPTPAPSPEPVGPAPPPPSGHQNLTVFNVLDFGAKGDGTSDDSKAFLAAWSAACQAGASTVLVPSGSDFLLKPISFSEPNCKSDIVFQLDGKIIAPTSSSAWGEGLLQWIEFKKLNRITVSGKGTIEGQGSVWWNNAVAAEADSIHGSSIESNLGKMPKTKPTVLRFYGSDQVTVTGITIQNSPQTHLKFDSCTNVRVFGISTSSPGDSPNTDGIHLQNSQNVLIHDVDLACGDDCVSIQTGCSNVHIHNVNCGPGHGISIGSLGKGNTEACVSNVTVRDTVMSNTMTGVRIKTWQGGSGSVQDIVFSNIQVSGVQTPIVIDQYYCDHGSGCKNQTSAVAVSGVTYADIRGTYTVQPVHLACSNSVPCTGISLSGIQLKPALSSRHLYDALCWEAYGELKTDTDPPLAGCLSQGKPTKSAPLKIISC